MKTPGLAAAIAILVAVALALPPEIAAADTPRPAALKVRTSDLDLSSEAGVDHLANRLVRRMWAICGHPTRAGLTHAMTGGGLPEREACKAGLAVAPDAHPGVRAAFAQALARF